MVFRTRGVKFRRNIEFPNPVQLKVFLKSDFRGNYSRVSRAHGITKWEQHVRIHTFVDGGSGTGPVSGLRCVTLFCTVFFLFVLRTFCSDLVLFSRRWALGVWGVHHGFSPEAV